jgi:MFS transporter, OFA family, oxalate/formate antiporter
VAALLVQASGSWATVFVLAACLDVLTAVLAITVLRPMRRRHAQRLSD